MREGSRITVRPIGPDGEPVADTYEFLIERIEDPAPVGDDDSGKADDVVSVDGGVYACEHGNKVASLTDASACSQCAAVPVKQRRVRQVA